MDVLAYLPHLSNITFLKVARGCQDQFWSASESCDENIGK